jgi:hypothetical protein
MRAFYLLFSFSLACCSGAQYSGPESVEYDAVNNRCFVSCTGSNSIKQRASDGTVTDFVTGISGAPYGIELKGDTLFACVGGGIKGYLSSDASEVFDLDLGGTFLNGLATDGVYLYTTDFSAKKVYKVDPVAGTFDVLVSNTVTTPNGIVYDAALDRLVMVAWGGSAPIKAVNKETGALSTLTTTALTNIDGITIDCHGNFIVASWSPDRLTLYEPTFTAPAVDLGANGLNNPADIDFDEVNGGIWAPNAGSNTVTFHAMPECSVNVNEVPGGMGYTTVHARPNPADGLIHIDLPLTAPTPFLVLNDRGLLIASGTLKPYGMLDVGSLAAGVYVIDLPSIKRYVRVVKN